MTYLVGCSSCDYKTLKDRFCLSDGHMTTHMRELLEHGYVVVVKEFIENRPRTTYKITPAGRHALQAYVDELRSTIEAVIAALDVSHTV